MAELIEDQRFLFGPRRSISVQVEDVQAVNGRISSFRVDGIIARRIEDELNWGVGDIETELTEYQQLKLGALVVSSIAEVDEEELPYSACTDGRPPVSLGDSAFVPVRMQVVGSAPMVAFAGAEALGEDFYIDPSAPVMERFEEVQYTLTESGLVVCTHNNCGGREKYTPIQQFSRKLLGGYSEQSILYRRRQLEIVGADRVDEVMDRRYLKSLEEKEESYLREFDPERAEQIIRGLGGAHAYAKLSTDGGGVHGHTESAIYQLDAETLPTSGINERLVFELSGGKEVFSITRGLIRALAVILGNGDAEKARVAENAMHHYTSAAHGALAKGLPTFIASLA